jgi:hypothetical protein
MHLGVSLEAAAGLGPFTLEGHVADHGRNLTAGSKDRVVVLGMALEAENLAQ